jgi:hypothetical protein
MRKKTLKTRAYFQTYSKRITDAIASIAITAEFRTQNRLRAALLTEVKQSFYMALRLSLCTTPNLKSAVILLN